MGSPINGSLYAHKAIRLTLNELEETADHLDSMDDAQISSLAERVDIFHKAVKSHNEGEEAVIWPAIDARFPHVTLPYTLDHRVDEESLQATEEGLRDLRQAGQGAERAGRIRKLRRLFTEINVSISHHANREDAHIIPILLENFTLPEQGEMARGAIAHVPGEVMPWMVPAMVRAITPDEQEDYVTMLMNAMPPQAFRAAAGWIKDGIPQEQWSELSARMPQLDAASK